MRLALYCSISMSLPERVVAAEERLRHAADRVGEVLELELVAVRLRDLDPLHLVAAAELQGGRADEPRISDDDRALGADRLEVSSVGQVERRVDQRRQHADRVGDQPGAGLGDDQNGRDRHRGDAGPAHQARCRVGRRRQGYRVRVDHG